MVIEEACVQSGLAYLKLTNGGDGQVTLDTVYHLGGKEGVSRGTDLLAAPVALKPGENVIFDVSSKLGTVLGEQWPESSSFMIQLNVHGGPQQPASRYCAKLANGRFEDFRRM